MLFLAALIGACAYYSIPKCFVFQWSGVLSFHSVYLLTLLGKGICKVLCGQLGGTGPLLPGVHLTRDGTQGVRLGSRCPLSLEPSSCLGLGF